MVKQIDVENKEVSKLYSISHTFKSDEYIIIDDFHGEAENKNCGNYINNDFNLDINLDNNEITTLNIVANTDVEPAYF
jgi:hypothetical protein